MKNIKDIILILVCGLCLWLLIKPNETDKPQTITEIETRIEYNDSKIKELESIIDDRNKQIKQFENKVINKTVNNQILEDKIYTLSILLDSAKQARDTIKIIQIQDYTILTQKSSNDTLKSIINLKDSIISNKDSIIDNKDSINAIKDIIIEGKDDIIEVLEVDLKKKKRQRNVLGIIGVALVGLLVVK